MSTPTAKDLLAQADRMMRQRTPEELPVLTDLVVEEIDMSEAVQRMRQHKPSTPTAPAQAVQPTPSPVPHAAAPLPGAATAQSALALGIPPAAEPRPLPKLPPGAAAAIPGARTPVYPPASAARSDDPLGVRPRMAHDSPAPTPISAVPTTTASAANVREQFNAQLIAKLEELQHSVFSQVMQQLELHAAGALKTHLRQTLEPALMDIARDIAEQVAEDTSAQVRDVVSKAVDSEIARLREQLARRRGPPEPRS